MYQFTMNYYRSLAYQCKMEQYGTKPSEERKTPVGKKESDHLKLLNLKQPLPERIAGCIARAGTLTLAMQLAISSSRDRFWVCFRALWFDPGLPSVEKVLTRPPRPHRKLHRKSRRSYSCDAACDTFRKEGRRFRCNKVAPPPYPHPPFKTGKMAHQSFGKNVQSPPRGHQARAPRYFSEVDFV